MPLDTLPPIRHAVRYSQTEKAAEIFRQATLALQVAAEAEDTDLYVFRLTGQDGRQVVCYCGTKASSGLIEALGFFLQTGSVIDLPPEAWLQLDQKRQAAFAEYQREARRN